MGFFDFSIDDFLGDKLPVALRRTDHQLWIYLLNSPVAATHDKFTSLRTDNLYRLNHDGQVTSLERALNDVFDPEYQSIFIQDWLLGEPVYVYLSEEHRECVYLPADGEFSLNPPFLCTDSEVSYSGTFKIIVDGGLGADEARLREIVDRYKLPGTTYVIIYY